jgi:hypothetical protein
MCAYGLITAPFQSTASSNPIFIAQRLLNIFILGQTTKRYTTEDWKTESAPKLFDTSILTDLYPFDSLYPIATD